MLGRAPLCAARRFWSGLSLCARFLGMRALRANAFQENGRWFVVRVLGDELSFEGAFEDGLAEAGGALEFGGDLGFEAVDDR